MTSNASAETRLIRLDPKGEKEKPKAPQKGFFFEDLYVREKEETSLKQGYE